MSSSKSLYEHNESSGRYKPLPEVVSRDGQRYEIIDSRSIPGLPTNGMVDQVQRRMIVPLDESGLIVSRHEMAHVLWSPERIHPMGVPVAFFQAVEDGRINRGLEIIGLPMTLPKDEARTVVALGESDLEQGTQGLCCWALRTAASYGTNVVQPLLDLVEDAPMLPLRGLRKGSQSQRVRDVVLRVHGKLERGREWAAGPVAEEWLVPLLARWMYRELRALGLPDPPQRPTLICCSGVPGGPPADPSNRRKRNPLPSPGSRQSGPGAGKLTIAEPELPIRVAVPSRGLRKGRRSATEGIILRDLARYPTDQRIFATIARCRRGGGSVLIDVSGSMSLTARDIDALIAAAPAATLVAIYSGKQKEGELRVVVRNGRRIGVDGLEPFGGANVVDLPALEWLAKQPEPRVWISDGHVTGERDLASAEMTQRCSDVCRRASIERVDDTRTAAQRLSGRRVKR